MTKLTQKFVRKLFTYKDGNLYWKVSRQKIQIGDKAGSLNKSTRYYQIKINDKIYLTHRLIHLYFNDYLPKEIDHIDGNSQNNNINNLRKVTHSENLMNQKITKKYNNKNSTSLYKGVCWHKRLNKWQSRIQIDGKRINLGYFKSELAAAFIYNVYARGAFGEYACLNEF